MIDPENPTYVRLRFVGPNGVCDITGNGVISPSNVGQQDNFFTNFSSMYCD